MYNYEKAVKCKPTGGAHAARHHVQAMCAESARVHLVSLALRQHADEELARILYLFIAVFPTYVGECNASHPFATFVAIELVVSELWSFEAAIAEN